MKQIFGDLTIVCGYALFSGYDTLTSRINWENPFLLLCPEKDLHPREQRKLAREIARKVNEGTKVVMATHSDYIIKELNTLIMLGSGTKHAARLMEKYGYTANEVLKAERVRCYEFNSTKLQQCLVQQDTGIAVPTFDKEINHMNDVQEEILYGITTEEE